MSSTVAARLGVGRGVLALYAVSEKDNPARIIVFEMYADADAYKAHLETSHFGVKGIAELAMVAVAPAITNAIFQGTSKRIANCRSRRTSCSETCTH